MNHTLRVLVFSGLSAATILLIQPLKKDDYLLPEKLPRAVQLYQKALGDRLQVPGKGKAISSGTLTDRRCSAAAALSSEAPSRRRLDRLGSANRVIQAGARGLAIASAQGNLTVLQSRVGRGKSMRRNCCEQGVSSLSRRGAVGGWCSGAELIEFGGVSL